MSLNSLSRSFSCLHQPVLSCSPPYLPPSPSPAPASKSTQQRQHQPTATFPLKTSQRFILAISRSPANTHSQGQTPGAAGEEAARGLRTCYNTGSSDRAAPAAPPEPPATARCSHPKRFASFGLHTPALWLFPRLLHTRRRGTIQK